MPRKTVRVICLLAVICVVLSQMPLALATSNEPDSTPTPYDGMPYMDHHFTERIVPPIIRLGVATVAFAMSLVILRACWNKFGRRR